MTKNPTYLTEKPQSRRFTIAVTLYLAGIVTFSACSFWARHYASLEWMSDSTTVPHLGALIDFLEIIFLLIMAVPLVLYYNNTKARSSQEVAELNAQLQRDYEKLKTRENELQDAIRDLERFNAVATGREERIIELKSEVNGLLRELSRPHRYTVKQVD